MKFDFSTPTPLQYFTTLVRSDEHLPLLEAAASLAQDEYPELDVQQVLSDVDHLAARLARRVAEGAGAVDRLRALNQLFFADLGFGGNVNDYYNPDNSYLQRVLLTRRGIPISLAVLWLELAQGLGLNVQGIGFPGHFLVQVTLDEGRVVIDPFTGQSLGRGELRERIEEFHPQLPYTPSSDLPLALYLRPTSPRQILARMLRNLQDIHRTQEDWQRFVPVQDRLIALLPDAWTEYRDRGLALAELGERARARADLSQYLQEAGDTSDREAMADRLAELGRSMS
ncbi:SirB1 family protein [Ottowia beijingensis]|uniref:SirB1 family protein n=1 Tax=Ottowia beijingensis TaxID=1207057 RepID=UPI002FDAF0B2